MHEGSGLLEGAARLLSRDGLHDLIGRAGAIGHDILDAGKSLLESGKGWLGGEGRQVVYRAINNKDVETLGKGLGLVAKNPRGDWTLGEHIIGGSGPESWIHDPWISTTRDLDVARGFDHNGIVAIDLNRVSSLTREAWLTYPRVGGVAGLPYHLSIWQQEVSVLQSIPMSAILGWVR